MGQQKHYILFAPLLALGAIFLLSAAHEPLEIIADEIVKWPAYREHFKRAEVPGRKQEKGFGVAADFLYFQATEDFLRYGEVIPITASPTQRVKNLDQEFSWDPGVRVSFIAPAKRSFEVLGSWMYFQAKPDPVYVEDPNFGLLAGFAIPIFGFENDVAVDSIYGAWQLRMNIFDLGVRGHFRPFSFVDLTPWFGILGGTIDQAVTVKYGDFAAGTPDCTPSFILGRSRARIVGPEMGLGFKCYCFFLNANAAGVYNWFSLKTEYTDFLSEIPDATLEMTESTQRLLPYAQVQAGLTGKWVVSSRRAANEISMELAAGWEEQFWWGQMRINWFSSVVSPQSDSMLTLGGAFARCRFNF